jgi:hypothetical protein
VTSIAIPNGLSLDELGAIAIFLFTPTFFDIFEGVQADQGFTPAVFQLLASLLFLLLWGVRSLSGCVVR